MNLSVRHLSYTVDGQDLVCDLTAEAATGDVIGLVGPNGAGKSTLADLVTGFARPTKGGVELFGTPISGRSPDTIARLGIVRTFQRPHLPWNATVSDCIRYATSPHRAGNGRGGQLREGALFDVVAAIVEASGVEPQSSAPVRDLSIGQMRALGTAMALARPSHILILDEPFAGLRQGKLTEMISTAISEAAIGRAMIVIDHALPLIKGVASRFWFMSKGKLSHFANYTELTSSPQFKTDYLGASASSENGQTDPSLSESQRQEVPFDPGRWRKGDVVLKLKNVSAGYRGRAVLRAIDLDVHAGEVVCIIGPNGAGKSTMLRAIMGAIPWRDGEIVAGGRQTLSGAPDKMTRLGLRLLTQTHRLFRTLTLRDNLVLAAAGYRPRANKLGSFVLGKTALSDVSKCLKTLGLTQKSGRYAGTFSGGEQARIALAAIQLADPQVVLLDEPTSGMDGASANALLATLSEWQGRGVATVLVEHGIEFVARVATRVLLISQGAVEELLLPEDNKQEYIVEKLKNAVT